MPDEGGGGRHGPVEDDHQRHAKKQKMEHDAHATDPPYAAAGPPPPPPMNTYHDRQPRHQSSHHNVVHHVVCCAGCGVSESASSGPLLLFEDPEEEDGHDAAKKPEDEKRYCAGCMTGKKVRVFWPVDSQWYIANVQQYDTNTGEHLLCYPDGDTEWVRIGEDHTTNTQYKEYFSSLKSNNGGAAAAGGSANNTQGNNSLTRMPSLGGGNTGGNMSFALSQSFGIPTAAEDEKTMVRLKPPSQQQRLFQQLNLDRTSSSMSSFGMYPGGIGMRQPSFGQHGGNGGRAPPFQILSPNFTHSFSSKIGADQSLEFGPPPHTSGKAGEQHHGPPPPLSYAHSAHSQQQREEGSANLSAISPGTRDGVPAAGGSHPPSWPPPNQYSNPNYYDGGHQMMYGHGYPPGGPPPSDPSYKQPTYDSKQLTKGHPTPPQTTSSKQPKSTKKESAKSRKALAKAWHKAEDEYLLDLVLQMKHPLKWSIIAQSLSDYSAGVDSNTPVRTGKQCRERYVNHLNPRLKHTEFNPLEDATIWRLYATIGTQWAKMSKVIPGRTDNNLKNRFHNLKRQLQREEDRRLRGPPPEEPVKGYKKLIHSDKIREIPQFLRTKIEEMWNHQRHIGHIAANSVQESREEDQEEDSGGAKEEVVDEQQKDSAVESSMGAAATEDDQKFRKFGPFETVTEPVQCGRCGLFMPSVQCGDEMCTKTKWCRVCAKVSMHLGGNVLRECMNLRKSQDGEVAKGVEKLLANDVNKS
eukprot:CAMPEP_0172314676 /NCGR_PEP_ID=MMETSP1058-20130122/23101_1 /TAXON_ID=83371 /ORGANISM="Detonula confervacea, Strain CCMP 353" /LENGTH=747 /DNA_ID=CAMNT_0013028605 /DNA_START=101 /DNA_END=2344 /DNA_ORIENTATION=+